MIYAYHCPANNWQGHNLVEIQGSLYCVDCRTKIQSCCEGGGGGNGVRASAGR